MSKQVQRSQGRFKGKLGSLTAGARDTVAGAPDEVAEVILNDIMKPLIGFQLCFDGDILGES